MPAILNEAFQSPFNNYKDLNPHGQKKDDDSSSGSSNIRNFYQPKEEIVDQDKIYKKEPFNNDFNHYNPNFYSNNQQNYQQHYQQHYQPTENYSFNGIQASSLMHNENPYAVHNNNQNYLIAPPVLNMKHNCDNLIALILSCPQCRDKLHRIYSSSHINENKTGGGEFKQEKLSWDTLNTSIIGNFMFGILIIILINRIIKIKS